MPGEKNGSGVPMWAIGLISSLVMLLIGGAWTDIRSGISELRAQQRADTAKLEKATGQIEWLREEVRDLREELRKRP